MRINHNIASLNTHRQMTNNTNATSKALEKLSSGLRINRAGDDAAGLAISEKMRGQIRGLEQASRNAQDSISLIQTAEGALSTTHNILQRMRELAVQAANSTSTDSDRAELQKEVAQLKSEVDRIASTTEFNSKKLLNGSLSAAKTAQGSVANSGKFDVLDTLGTGGSTKAGTATAVSAGVAGVSGSGSSYTAGAELADKTIIQTGVNDRFNIQINGNNYEATIAASSSAGYSKQEFVDALNAAVKNAVGSNWENVNNQASFSLGADGRLSVTTASNGSFAKDTITVSQAIYNDANQASAAVAAADLEFTMTYNGYTTADISPAAITAGDASTVAIADLQTEVDTALAAAATAAGTTYTNGTVQVGMDQAGRITFTDTQGTGTLGIAAANAGTVFTDADKIESTNVKVFGSAVSDQSAISAMGYDQKAVAVNGTVDLSGGLTITATNTQFDIQIGNKTTSIDLTADASATTKLTSGQNYTLSQIKDALQSALDNKLGKGSVTVDTTDGRLTLTNNVGTKEFAIIENVGAGRAGLFDAAADITSSPVLQGNNVITAGKDTINAVNAGTVISKGANDQFTLGVDGGAAKTLTLTAGTYGTASDLVTEINNQINADADLVGKVKASLTSDGKVQFLSTSTGTQSNVVVDDPAVKGQSALGALGYNGYASQLTQDSVADAVDIKNGLDLTDAADRKFDVTLGNKTVTIDLSFEAGITTNGTLSNKLTSGDAIVNALQKQLDKAFGANAITVSTVATETGEQNLVLTSNARSSALTVTNGSSNGVDNNGATKLFGATAGALNSVTAEVSATVARESVAGTDAVDNVLDTNTKLTDLSDVDGNRLGLTKGNVINISGTQNGNAFSAAVTVNDNSTVSDIMNAIRNLDAFKGATISLDAENGKFVVKGADGADQDISNLKFGAQKSSTDTTGVASFNTMFGNFNVTQQAQNAASDSSLSMQIGANEGQTLNVDVNDMGTSALRIQNVDVSTTKGAQTAISVINNALETVSAERSKLGAYQNRLEHTISNLGTSAENLTASESRIRDVDMAKEMMEFTKNNILSQAAQAMLAQANQQPQGVLQLLR